MNIVEIMEIIIFSLLGGMIIFCIFILIRNGFVFKVQIRMSNAIHGYNCWLIEQHRFNELISYDVIEEYDATMKRFWDWTHKRLVPPDIFELIKPWYGVKKED